MEDYTVIKTYADLIKYVQDNNLENEQVIVGCEGYDNYNCALLVSDVETRIAKFGDKHIICDTCTYEMEERYNDEEDDEL